MIFNKKLNLFKNVVLICFVLFFGFFPLLSLAQYGLEETAKQAGLNTSPERDLPTIIGQGVNYLFGVIGVIFLTVILIGGYLWMTAGGNEEKVSKAKGFIMNGINGMIVIFLAYALVYVILIALKGASGS